MKNIIEEYFKLQEEIYKHFGYAESWKVIPLDDQLNRHWMICGPEDENNTKIAYSDKPFTPEVIAEGKECYSGVIYTQRFLEKWVYRSSNYTMISVDTRCDGNKLLMIFDNNLECKDEELKKQYMEYWGTI